MLSPTFTVYQDTDAFQDTYFLLGISHTFELSDMVALKLCASASYLKCGHAHDTPEVDNSCVATDDEFSNFHDGVISAALPITLTKYISVTPLLSWVFPLSDDASNRMEFITQDPDDRDDNYVVGGATVSLVF